MATSLSPVPLSPSLTGPWAEDLWLIQQPRTSRWLPGFYFPDEETIT